MDIYLRETTHPGLISGKFDQHSVFFETTKDIVLKLFAPYLGRKMLYFHIKTSHQAVLWF